MDLAENRFRKTFFFHIFYHIKNPINFTVFILISMLTSFLFNMYKNSNICDKIRIFIRKSF